LISKFFIDRPIFATVLSVLITLTGLIAVVYLPIAQYPRITPPSVNVSISYPGASAQVVADTVAAPIEQQVTGVPGMLYMSSLMGNDGSYSLQVTFDVSVDLNTALVMVQNRVTLAMPLLPTPVQQQGITIRKKTPDNLCMVNFLSPDGRYDDIYLSNFALINVKDELLRVDGVSDISIMGERDYSIRIWLDAQKLASRGMTANDVANAIRSQNIEAAAGRLGQPPVGRGQAFELPIDTLGRLNQPEQFGNIIVKVGQSRPMLPSSGGAPTTVASPATPVQLTTAAQGLIAQIGTVSSGTTTSGSTGGAPTSTGTTSGPAITTGMTSGGLAGGASSSGGATAGGGATTGGGATVGGAATAGTTAKKGGPTASSPSKAKVGGGNIAGQSTSVSVVRLKDVARIEMGALNYNQFCTFDGKPAVGLNVYQLPGTNALDVADRVRAKMEELKKRFPEGLEYKIAYDTTPFIRESVADVIFTLLAAVALVAIVVLVFLQDWRAMILPMIDVPVSLIGTFAVMAALGYTLNNISLFGLVLAIGIVVDDAIVVLENIERQMAKGFDTRTATIKAMEEISGPILAITLVLCAVFIPCAFVSGITGRFFRQFALTISASTIISAVNALTMTPSRALVIFKAKEALSPLSPPARGVGGEGSGAWVKGATPHSHKPEALPWWIFGALGGLMMLWLGPRFLAGPLGFAAAPEGQSQSGIDTWLSRAAFFTPGLLAGLVLGWFIIRPVNAVLGLFFQGFNRAFDQMTTLYGWAIGQALRLSMIVLLVYGGLLLLTYYVFRDAPTGFVPQQDQGRLIVSVQLPDSSSLERTREAMAQVEAITREVPGVAHTIGLGGISFVEQANGPNFGSLFVILEPFDKRPSPELRAEGIMARLRKECTARVKDARVVVAGASPIPGLSVAGGFKVMVQDRGGIGLLTLQAETDKLIQKMKTADLGLAGVATQFRSNIPQLFMNIDRSKVASLGVSLDDVNQALEIFLGSHYVNSFNDFGRHWQVTLQADKQFRSFEDEIKLLQVRNNAGQMVPLATLVALRDFTGPIFVRRYNLYTAGPVTGSLLPGVSSGDVIAGVDKLADETLPRSMKADWTELMFMQIKEGNTTGIVFALAVMCVFLALSALYESWTLPLAVILVVPLCVLFSLAGVLYTNNSLNIFVQIGLVVLVGLACKNAILVVEFAKQLHQQGQSVFEATVVASKLRLRPILMTSFAFILGVVPLCIASGAGAEMRRSLGTAVFSGMLGVTLFGIFLTPVFFYVIQGVGETRLFTGALIQFVGSCLIGGLLGAATGFLLGKLGVFLLPWAAIVGGVAGVLGVLAALGVHRTIRRL